MRTRCRRFLTWTAAALAAGGMVAAPAPADAQGGAIPRTSWDKKPDLNGIWQVMNTANWDLGGSRRRSIAGLRHRSVGRPPAGSERRRRRHDSLQARSARQAGAEPEERAAGQARAQPRRRPRAELLPARRAARDLHAPPVSDFPEPEPDVDGLRVLVRAA